MTGGVEFLKGHGTENDFVLLPDVGGSLDLTESRVRALCDRRAGIGGDGVLRVVRCAAEPDAPSTVDGWFMDYRNSDGSIAEMCGNGVRVFARYLVEAGLQERGEFVVHTRAGERPVEVHEDLTVTVHMGVAEVFGESVATLAGAEFKGTAVDVGNPHLVCVTDTDIRALDLTAPPVFDTSLFPRGVNVEFVNRVGEGAIAMRVFERGAGETRACGTGTVACVAAVLHADGVALGAATVDQPGGRVRVTVDADGTTLGGPAVLVASGELDRAWWNAH
jgi:diaminopimelate epimerase